MVTLASVYILKILHMIYMYYYIKAGIIYPVEAAVPGGALLQILLNESPFKPLKHT